MGNQFLSFKGKSYHTINEVGRISIPAKFRDILKTKYADESLILVTLGTHIVAYPLWSGISLKKCGKKKDQTTQK